jgi:hypothetical protein
LGSRIANTEGRQSPHNRWTLAEAYSGIGGASSGGGMVK